MINFSEDQGYEGVEGIPPNSKPVFLDKKIWEIAKKGMVEGNVEAVNWAIAVKLYREMGGRIEFRPISSE